MSPSGGREAPLSLDARAPVGAFCPLPGAEGAEVYATATDAAAGLTFALLELPDGGRELVALGRSGGSGALELRWRARVPTRTILVQHGADGRVTLMNLERDRNLDSHHRLRSRQNAWNSRF